MKIKSLFALLALAIVLFVGAWTMQPARTQWEYKRAFFNYPELKPDVIDKQINDLGAQGWELVAFYPERISSQT